MTWVRETNDPLIVGASVVSPLAVLMRRDA
jgi:hypothetical protein